MHTKSIHKFMTLRLYRIFLSGYILFFAATLLPTYLRVLKTAELYSKRRSFHPASIEEFYYAWWSYCKTLEICLLPKARAHFFSHGYIFLILLNKITIISFHPWKADIVIGQCSFHGCNSMIWCSDAFSFDII